MLDLAEKSINITPIQLDLIKKNENDTHLTKTLYIALQYKLTSSFVELICYQIVKSFLILEI